MTFIEKDSEASPGLFGEEFHDGLAGLSIGCGRESGGTNTICGKDTHELISPTLSMVAEDIVELLILPNSTGPIWGCICVHGSLYC